jgi:hypothetical protein
MMPPCSVPKRAREPRWVIAASVLALVVYFAIASYDGLHAYFTGDDGGNLMKMHQYFRYSFPEVISSALRVVSGSYRPLGGVYYFIFYGIFGFHPLPFRIFCLLVAMANVVLAFTLMRRLSGSLTASMTGAVLMVHHPAMLELLYSSGTIYEILCFFFYFLAIYFYFTWREEGQLSGQPVLSWRRVLAIAALTGGALDSKEMAMTLPAALLLLELIYFCPVPWSWRAALRQSRGVLASAALTVPTIAVKVLTKNPLSDDTRYRSHSLNATVDAMRGYHHFLLSGLLSSEGLPALKLVLLWIGMLVIAIKARSRPMQFGLGFLIVALMPVCLIFPRGGYMAYIPLMGWALYVGCLFELVTDELLQALCVIRFKSLVKLAAFVAAAAAIIAAHADRIAPYAGYFREHQHQMRGMIERLRTLHPKLPHGSSILLVDDPEGPGFEMLFLAQLAYHDPDLELDRTRMLPALPAGNDLIHYDMVLAGGADFRDVRGIDDPRPPVEVRVQSEGGGVFGVEIPEFAGQAVDLATRAGELHSVLDSCGSARISTERVRWIRPAGGEWMAARFSAPL